MAEVKLYEVVKPTKLYEIDDINSVGFPRHKGKGKQIIIRAGSILQSTGRTKRAKIFTNEKPTFLILLDGDGVRLEDVKLKEAVVTEVVDTNSEVNTPLAETNYNRFEENVENKHNISSSKEMDNQNVKTMNEKENVSSTQDSQESEVYQAEIVKNNPQPALSKDDIKKNRIGYRKFDNTQIVGALIGAALFGFVVWRITKNKWKTGIAAFGGLIIGGAIGRVLGRTGEKKIAEVQNVEETKIAVNINPQTDISPPEKEAISKPAQPQQYYQVGQTYSFKTPQLIQPMAFMNGVLYMASQSDGKPAKIEPGSKVTGKLVEITEPVLFLANAQSKKIEQSKINIPLPFIEIKDNIFIPLGLLSHDGGVMLDELAAWMENQPEGKVLENEIYVKGRYAGRRSYYLMYLPTHSANISSEFKLNMPK